MAVSRYRKDRIGDHRLHPETLMLGYGYDPALSEGAVKQPVFLTSTFVFRTAEERRDFFDFTARRREPDPTAAVGLVYSRFNHPNSEIVEDRLAVYEGAETAAIFSSGMSAIATTILAYTRPGDVILHSQPLYGGTETLVSRTLEPFGIGAVGFMDGVDPGAATAAAESAMAQGRVSVILIETPSNPLNSLLDIALVSRVADQIAASQGQRPMIVCDNTLLGPVFQKPLAHGGDVMRGWWVRDAVGSATCSLTVVALDRLIGLLAFCAVGLVAAAFVPSVARDAPAIWFVVAVVVLALAVLALVAHPAAAWLARRLLALPLLRGVRDKAQQAGAALAGLRRARVRLALSFGWGVLLQLNVIAQFVILAAALEVDISLWTLAVLIPLVNLITLLPVSINGFGVREGALAALGGPFGLSLEGAVLLGYAWVFCALAWGLVGGVIYVRGQTEPPPSPART